MTSEGPRHANQDPAAFAPDDDAQPPLGGARGSATVPTARASASVPIPPGPPQPYEPRPYVPAQQARPGSGRATGLAQVPDAALLPAHQLPPLPLPVPRVYGRPATPPLPTSGPPAMGPGPGPLPGPATGQAAAPGPGFGHASVTGPASGHASAPGSGFGHASVTSPGGGHASVTGPGGGHASVTGPAGGHAPMAGYAAGPPAAAGSGLMAQSTAGPAPPPAAIPAQYGPPPFGQSSQPASQPFQVPEWQTEDDHTPQTDSPGSHTGLLIAVGAVVLVAVVGLVAFLWPRGDPTAGFAVNTCVRQSGTSAIAADCSETGAFTIVARVTNKDQCPDALQPYVELSTGAQRILCLAPTNTGPAPTTTTPAPGST